MYIVMSTLIISNTGEHSYLPRIWKGNLRQAQRVHIQEATRGVRSFLLTQILESLGTTSRSKAGFAKPIISFN
jgi:hypothetical protein